MKKIKQNNKILLKMSILIITIMIIFSGCIPFQKQESKEKNNAKLISDENSIKAVTDEGEVIMTEKGDTSTMSVKNNNNEEEKIITATSGEEGWCSKGAGLNINTDNDNMQSEVLGIETEGKYKGLCHSYGIITTPEGKTEIHYYYDEDDETVYQVYINDKGETFEIEG